VHCQVLALGSRHANPRRLRSIAALTRNEFKRDRGPAFSWMRDTGHEGHWSLISDGAGYRLARSSNHMAIRRAVRKRSFDLR
jgi:hypothetical protein